MLKLLSFVLTPLFYLSIILHLLVFHPFFLVAKYIFGEKGMHSCTNLFNLSASQSLLLLGTKVKYINFNELPTASPILIICNHQSMWDIPSLMWKLRNNHPKFIVKKELAKNIPTVSFIINHGGSVAIDRSDSKGAIDKIKTFSKVMLEKKHSICIFPEGTRSKDGKIRNFKTSGIETIIKEIPNITVVPIAIKGTGKLDNYGKFLKNVGVKVSFQMLEARNLNLNTLDSEINKIRKEMIAVVE